MCSTASTRSTRRVSRSTTPTMAGPSRPSSPASGADRERDPRTEHTMETITLNNGVAMPALGLGVFQTPPDETRDAVRAALDAGYRLIDTAAAYGHEREGGEAVHSSELPRSDVFLETKVWISDYG